MSPSDEELLGALAAVLFDVERDHRFFCRVVGEIGGQAKRLLQFVKEEGRSYMIPADDRNAAALEESIRKLYWECVQILALIQKKPYKPRSKNGEANRSTTPAQHTSRPAAQPEPPA